MASTKIQLDTWVKKAIKLATKDIATKKVLTKLGEEVVARIRKRTRLGFGVREDGGKKEPLKGMRKHSPNYTAWRKSNPGSLSSLTSPVKHNLTLTGNMLDDMKVTKINVGNKSIRLGFSKKFSQLKARVNADRGWEFLHLSNIEIKALNNFYRREVRKLVKRNK